MIGRSELREVFALHAAGKTTVIRETRPLADVNEAFADVEPPRRRRPHRPAALIDVARPYR